MDGEQQETGGKQALDDGGLRLSHLAFAVPEMDVERWSNSPTPTHHS